MRRCVSSEGREYNEVEQFCSYTVEKRDGSRSYIVQFVRGAGDEQFFRYFLDDSAGPGAGERIFTRRKRTINRDDVVECLAEEGTRHALHVVPKTHLEAIITSFEVTDTIRASGLSQALNTLCQPLVAATGVDFNPIELLLKGGEKIAGKIVEDRCVIS